ncbi:MAG: hypothetical protein KIT14_25050 [bacterium]|nr:hypothetical protein [bacterium]
MRLDLFTAFHLNLDFSCVAPEDAGRVLDRCVWPLVDLLQTPGVALGLEVPASSLSLLAALDPLLLDAIRAAIAAGRLELVGSGLAQVILPLVPAAVGAHDLRRGRDVYRELLGAAPRVAYLHEQTYAAGLVPLYREAGYEALIAEWENPASAHGWPGERRYRAAWIAGTNGSRIAGLWNSSVVFQRVQRFAHGEIDLDEVVALLASHVGAAAPRALCLYGNDAEVFDHRPGSGALRYGSGPQGEWERLGVLVRALAADPRFALVTPSAALAAHPPVGEPLRLESADAPLPAKKQAKYNVTRWAVCGRDNVRRNARCHALARRLDVAEALARAAGGAGVGEGDVGRCRDALGRLWGSDLRTHTTDARHDDAAARLGALAASVDAVLGRLEAPLAPPAPDAVVLFNPHPFAWTAQPFATTLAWPPGVVRGGLALLDEQGRRVPSQLEEVETHRDGSLRRAVVVLAPTLPALGTLRLRCTSAPAPAEAGPAPERLDTASTTLVLSARRGAAVRALGFPHLGAAPLAGTVPQGAFDPIELAADWYTGHLVLHDAAGAKHTDLEPVALRYAAPPSACPIRVPVVARLGGPWGECWKTVWAYRDVPRVDVRYHLVLRDQRPRSLRLGVLTLAPDAFAPGALRYATVNGGRDVETFALGDARVGHGDPVSFGVTARACLGATEGWVDVGDAARGVTMAWDPSRVAPAPMVQHTPAGDRALTRVSLSLAESDETAAPHFRGHTTLTVSYLGRGADPAEMRRQAIQAASGLHVVRRRAAPSLMSSAEVFA